MQIRRDDGAFVTIASHRGSQASTLRPHLDALLDKETTAHLASLGFEALVSDKSASTSHRHLPLVLDLKAQVSSLQSELEESKGEAASLRAVALGPSGGGEKNSVSEMGKIKVEHLEKEREIEKLQGKVKELQTELERSANVSDLLKTELRLLENSGLSRGRPSLLVDSLFCITHAKFTSTRNFSNFFSSCVTYSFDHFYQEGIRRVQGHSLEADSESKRARRRIDR